MCSETIKEREEENAEITTAQSLTETLNQLFLFVRPVRYAKSSLLALTALSTYTTIDRIIKDLKFKGKSFYIPPSVGTHFPEDSRTSEITSFL